MGWKEAFSSLFGRASWQREIPPPPEPPFVPLRLPPRQDAPDMLPPMVVERTDAPRLDAWKRRPAEELAADLTCAIAYTDATGEPSRRRISIKTIMTRDGRSYLNAYCHERQAPRQFLVDRVDACWDRETGEVIDLHAWMRTLAPAPPRAARPKKARRVPEAAPALEATPEEQAEDRVVLGRCGDGMRVLRYLSLCDGDDAPAERRVIREFVFYACEGTMVGMERVWSESKIATRLARRMHPTHESYLAAIRGVVAQGKPMARLVAQSALDLIQADGVVHRIERDHADELGRLLLEM